MAESIKVFQNLYDNVINFESKEEFMNYYKKHQNEIDSMKTRGINVRYKIPGYRIGRQKNQILLFPTKKEDDENDDKNENQNSLEIHEKINVLNRRLKKIEEMLTFLCENLKNDSFSDNY